MRIDGLGIFKVRAAFCGLAGVLLATLPAAPVHAQAAPAAPAVTLTGTTEAAPAGATSNRGAAWRLLAGYQFSNTFGLEAAYGDLGRYGYASGIPGLSALGDVRMRAWSLAGTGNLALGTSWSLTGKVGLGSKQAELGRFGGPLAATPWAAQGGTRSDLLLGLGLGYSVGRGFGLRFEYENYGAAGGAGNGVAKGDQWAVSLKYSF